MDKWDRQILLEDLCGRVPFDTIVQVGDKDDNKRHTRNCYIRSVDTFGYDVVVDDYINDLLEIEDVKPYLRPLSSMTEEEKQDLLFKVLGSENNAKRFKVTDKGEIVNIKDKKVSLYDLTWVTFNPTTVTSYISWCNKNHFDYRGLIQMGLALEAPADMYSRNTK